MSWVILCLKKVKLFISNELRSSALGVQYVAGRVGAILGNILFGLAVDINCLIPLVTITGLLVLSGVITLKLPESKNADIG